MNRHLHVQMIRRSLLASKPSLGSWIQIPHSSIAEIMGGSGYDWIAIDMEHGSIAQHQLPDLCRALELRSTLPLVRLAECSAKEAKYALDAGAGGIIVPMVNSLDQLLHIIEASRWPPSGHRGVGFSRANLFGAEFDAYKLEAQAPLVVAMIETATGLANIEAILSAPGLDAVMVGPYDLSASLGVVGEFSHPIYQDALKLLRTKALTRKVPLGIHVVEPDPVLLSEAISHGFLFCAYGIDAVFLNRFTKSPVELLNLE